jgi:hypothetical protein
VTNLLVANAVDLIVHLGWVDGERRMTSVRQVTGHVEAARSSPTSCGDPTHPARRPGRAAHPELAAQARGATASTRPPTPPPGVVAMSTSSSPHSRPGTALGLLLIVAGLTGRQILDAPSGYGAQRARRPLARPHRVAASPRSSSCAATGWLVGGVLAALTVLVPARVLGGKATRQRDRPHRGHRVVDRDDPRLDRRRVRPRRSDRRHRERRPTSDRPRGAHDGASPRPPTLPDALVAFGKDLNHPSGDLVVAALVIAARMEASDLSGLLSRLAEATRGEKLGCASESRSAGPESAPPPR